MFDHNDMCLLFKALRFSADKHRMQRRKDREASPYINHPIEVTEILCAVGQVKDIPTLIASILHDTIEDTKTEPHEIRDAFGEEVLSLVLEVSDDKRLPKQERKRLQIETAPKKSSAAKYIKLADKICNVKDVTNSPPVDWPLQRREQYFDWTEKVVAGLRGINPELEAYYDEVLRKGRRGLEIERSER